MMGRDRSTETAIALLRAERDRAVGYLKTHHFSATFNLTTDLRIHDAIVMARYMEFACSLVATGNRDHALAARDRMTPSLNALANGYAIDSRAGEQETGEQDPREAPPKEPATTPAAPNSLKV
jgi:hypothetical protein